MSVKVIKEPANAAVDIVLVHGLCANEQPWTQLGKDRVCWPESILPDLVPRARIMTFNYKANLDDFWGREKGVIDGVSDDLFGELRRVRSKTETASLSNAYSNIWKLTALVRGSNGSRAEKELNKRVRRIALIGTPFHADEDLWAMRGEVFFRLSGATDRAAKVRDDLTQSEKLAEIGKNFQAFVKSRTAPGDLEVASLYEGVATQMGATEVVIANELAVKIPGCPNPSRLEANHQGMAEAASENDPHFRRLSRVLVEWAEELGNVESDELARNQFNATFHGENRGFQLGQNIGTISGVGFGAEPAASAE